MLSTYFLSKSYERERTDCILENTKHKKEVALKVTFKMG